MKICSKKVLTSFTGSLDINKKPQVGIKGREDSKPWESYHSVENLFGTQLN